MQLLLFSGDFLTCILMRLLLVVLLYLWVGQFYASAQNRVQDFLPDNVAYNQEIPDPETWFGFAPGDRHLSHDQILAYAREVARLSDRVIIEEYARSHEYRPLIHVIVTSAGNHSQLDVLKSQHLAFSAAGSNLSPENIPLIVFLTYGVHGNESSAANASVLAMYHLAAAQGPGIESLLKQNIILIDPNLNPDGFARHSTWVNMHQGKTDVSDPNARGFTEAWPGGRGNHYWFDLNRDYLFMVHPESRGRIEKFHEWKPNIVTDHHEMGPNSTFFFQPGIPSRNNPLVPGKNLELTDKIAAFHSAKFDSRGELYYSEESFDDYYVGKGSSYPDINGSVGILFEQAGYRGKVRETRYGLKTLASAIKNQFDVTLSTLEAAMHLKTELLQSQKAFYEEAILKGQRDKEKGYIVGDISDPVKLNHFIDILQAHKIEVHKLATEVTRDGKQFLPGSSIIVPLSQSQYRLIKSLFETASEFNDSTFYDVSTWNLPMAFNLDYVTVSSPHELQLWAGDKIQHLLPSEGDMNGNADSYAWLMRWDNYNAPAVLWQLQKKGILTMVATREFTIEADGQMEKFSYGTIAIAAAGQKNHSATQLYDLLKELSSSWKVEFTGVKSGRTASGIDLGSGSFVPLTQPDILMVAGESVNSREAGEIWHLFDQRYEIPVTTTDVSAFRNISLYKYTTIILPGGNLRSLGRQDAQKIKTWIDAGGTLLTVGEASQWITDNEIAVLKFKRPAATDTGKIIPYINRSDEAAIHSVAGAILKAEADITHPLGYGYHNPEIAVFKTGTRVAEIPAGQHTAPVKYAQKPWMSGYISQKNLDRISGAPAVTVIRSGNGRVISFMESPNFRGIWQGTHKMVANSVFFGGIIR
jgi:hypothetical protein